MLNTRNKALGTVLSGLIVATMFMADSRDVIAQGNGNGNGNGQGQASPQADPDRNPWRAELCIVADYCEAPASVTAPADRSIVIDTFSGECSLKNGGVFRSMFARLDDNILHQFLPERAIVGTSHTIYDWNKQTRMVIPANGVFRISAFAVSHPPPTPDDLTYCQFYVSGYTVKP